MKRINKGVILAITLSFVLSALFVVSFFYEFSAMLFVLLPISVSLFFYFLYTTFSEKCDNEKIESLISASKAVYMVIISLMFAVTIFQLVQHRLDALIALTLIGMILAKGFSFMKLPQTS